VPAALVALQEADSRLAQLDRPKLLPLRKQITRDIERLRALPLADVTSMNVQLDGMLGQIDGLPMGFEHLPAKPVVASVAGSAKSQRKAGRSSQRNESASLPVAASAPQENDDTGFGSGVLTLMNDLWSDFSQLIRIERLDRPDPALLSPQSAAYLRENLRLRLLSARLALLQRDGKVLNEDVSQARIWLERYFDVTAPAVASMLTDLKQIEGAKLNVELPSLNETEAVLRNLRLDAR
ncbi:MAG TPA: uroporphyrinogen-III C-methyltransferase, partial [Rhodocyclaceae bacterium]|nr:uroporphyrinogen-III C-methyltransferase [Rhodocyclaceae bacterium]